MDLTELTAFIVTAKRAAYAGDGTPAPASQCTIGREPVLVDGIEAYALDYCGG